MSTIQNNSSATRTFSATCHCRASMLSFTVPIDDLPLPVHFCHCDTCRHAHGAMFTAGAGIPEPVVDISTFQAYRSSEHVTRWFCATCGAPMLVSTVQGEATRWFVSAASVDAEEEMWDFSAHIYVGSTGDGGLATLMTHIGRKEVGLWDKLAGRSAPWQFSPRTPDAGVPRTSPEDRLRAHCDCEGVEFFISRPTGDETFTEIDEDNVRKHKDKWLAIHDVCNTCRLTISTFVISWFFPSRDRITLPDGSPYPIDGIFGTARSYSTSAGVNRTFCGTCGATVSYVTDERPHVIDVATGLIDTANARAEDWLEWRTYKLAFEEDAVWKSVQDALKHGLQMSKPTI